MQPAYDHEFDIPGLTSILNFRVFTNTGDWQSSSWKAFKNWFLISYIKMVYLLSTTFDSNFKNSAIKVAIILCE